MATRNTRDSCTEINSDSTNADTSMTGARTSRRMPIIMVSCMALMSLVRRVISEAVENRSILLKEYS